jgi:PncC family amidohydrolase
MAQPIVRQIHKLLTKNKLTLAVAESCTGGMISKLLTELPGSSVYFLLGVVAYSNRAKSDILKIPAPTITTTGAVSSKVASLMAQQVMRLAKADFGIGTTGIAGPGGGSARKPAGTVFIAVCGKNKSICKKFRFSGSRGAVRNKAAIESLMLLKCALLSP